jgi:hypothetical protein
MSSAPRTNDTIVSVPEAVNPQPIREWLYGHRLRAGQTAIEYLLEFLNVVRGFNYKISVDQIGGEYQIVYRHDLRRFLFLDGEPSGGNRDKADVELLRRMQEAFAVLNLPEATVDHARRLLHSFAVVVGKRSWYAQFLFPAHEDLLFFEARRKGKGTTRDTSAVAESDYNQLQAGVAIERNFFSRGGELYFLMLAQAAADQPEQARRVGLRLQTLLQKHNSQLGALARNLDSTLTTETSDQNVEIGWLPPDADGLVTQVLGELDNLLAAEIDPIEQVYLLARLLPLHLLQHIYRRSHPLYPFTAFANGTAQGVDPLMVRPSIFIDCERGGESREIRRLSALTYKRNEYRQEEKFRNLVRKFARFWPITLTAITPDALREELSGVLNLGSLSKRKQQQFREELQQVWDEHATAEQRALAVEKALLELDLSEFRKQHLPVHRKLCTGVGFVQPTRGANQRYVFNDMILKALVLALLKPEEEIEYDQFLQRLYEAHGIVIGTEQAKQSGLFAEARINSEHFERNLLAFRRRMREAGLLFELSDATALVRNPYPRRAD